MWKPESEGAQPAQSSATEDGTGEDEEDLFAAYDYGYQLNVHRLFYNYAFVHGCQFLSNSSELKGHNPFTLSKYLSTSMMFTLFDAAGKACNIYLELVEF